MHEPDLPVSIWVTLESAMWRGESYRQTRRGKLLSVNLKTKIVPYIVDTDFYSQSINIVRRYSLSSEQGFPLRRKERELDLGVFERYVRVLGSSTIFVTC